MPTTTATGIMIITVLLPLPMSLPLLLSWPPLLLLLPVFLLQANGNTDLTKQIDSHMYIAM